MGGEKKRAGNLVELVQDARDFREEERREGGLVVGEGRNASTVTPMLYEGKKIIHQGHPVSRKMSRGRGGVRVELARQESGATPKGKKKGAQSS